MASLKVLLILSSTDVSSIYFISLSIFIIMFVYMYNFSEQFSNRINHAKKDIEKIIEQKNYNSSLGLRIIGSYYSLEIIKDNFFTDMPDPYLKGNKEETDLIIIASRILIREYFGWYHYQAE